MKLVALWQCDLRVSWRSQLFSLAVYSVLMLLVLLAPWPDQYWPIWMILLLIAIFECIRSQRKIAFCHGNIALLEDNCLYWQQQEWQIKQPVWMIDSGILLSISREKRQPSFWLLRRSKQKLWLAYDSMSQDEWRHLRQLLLSLPSTSEKQKIKSNG